ncbi:MAG: ankyrin repeat domain-containing protein [Spirochaetaceae bacterium]
MKVAFVFQKTDRHRITELLREARKRSLPAVAYRFSDHWQEQEFHRFRQRFQDLTHLVLTGEATELRERWSSFIAGMGLRRELALLCDGGELPGLFISVPVFREARQLFDYLEEQQRYHDRIGSIEQARQELIDEGLAITEQAMSESAAEGREEDLFRFMRIGFDANTRDDRGVPLLVTAVKNRRESVVELLLKHGADVNLISQDRLTSPLMEAAVLGEDGIASTLIDAGADLNLQSHNGQTALMMAISEGHTDLVKRLLAEGCETDQVDNLGMTARKYAELFKKEPILRLLDERGA